MEIDNNASQEVVDDAALFAELTAKEPTENTPVEEPDIIVSDDKQEEPKAVAAEKTAEPQENDQVKNLNAALREARQEAAEARRRSEEMMARFMAAQPPQPAPQPAPTPDIFEDPAAFVRAQVSTDFERQQQVAMYNSRLIAEARFGEDKVREAQEAFDALLAEKKLHPADYQRVMSSPNPFAEGVKWHQTHKAATEIGDPVAFQQKLRSQLLQDPDFRKEAMAAWQQAASAQRGAPNIRLPSLSRVGAAAIPSPSDDGNLTDAELWSQTIARKR